MTATTTTAVLLIYGEPAIFASPEEAESHVRDCWNSPDEWISSEVHGVEFLDTLCDGEGDEEWAWAESMPDGQFRVQEGQPSWHTEGISLWRVGSDGLAHMIEVDA